MGVNRVLFYPPPDLENYYKNSYNPGGFDRIVGDDKWPIFDPRPVSAILLSQMFCDFNAGDLFVDMGPGSGSSFFCGKILSSYANYWRY
jgi:hypothetical protein